MTEYNKKDMYQFTLFISRTRYLLPVSFHIYFVANFLFFFVACRWWHFVSRRSENIKNRMSYDFTKHENWSKSLLYDPSKDLVTNATSQQWFNRHRRCFFHCISLLMETESASASTVKTSNNVSLVMLIFMNQSF